MFLSITPLDHHAPAKYPVSEYHITQRYTMTSLNMPRKQESRSDPPHEHLRSNQAVQRRVESSRAFNMDKILFSPYTWFIIETSLKNIPAALAMSLSRVPEPICWLDFTAIV
jgi:hypothetical protein